MDKLFGSRGDSEWKSSGNILHYERFPIKDIRHPLLSHVYVQPILINQNQKNEKELGLSQLLVGKKIEIQERKPDLVYSKNNQQNLKKDTNTYYTSEFNIPDNSSIKVKSLQKLNKLGEKSNYPTLSTHNLSDQIRTIKTDDDKNNKNYQNNISSTFPTTVKRNSSNNNEHSIINSNIRRLSNINSNTLYKTPVVKKNNNESKKLVFHNVMKISSFTDYKDDIEQIEKAIQLSSSMNLNVNNNNISNNVSNKSPEFGSEVNNKYAPKNKSPLMNDITSTMIEDVPEITEIDDNNESKDKMPSNTENDNHPTTQVDLNHSEIQIEDISNTPNNITNTFNTINKNSMPLDNDNQQLSHNEVIENQLSNHNNNNEVIENQPSNHNNDDEVVDNQNNNINNEKNNTENELNENSNILLNTNNTPTDDSDQNKKPTSNKSNITERANSFIDEKLKQEQRDRLLENEPENEKKLDYHLFMSSTQKIGTEQKIDEIVVSEEGNEEHSQDINTNDNTSENGEKQ
ncbi:hypothetical protein PIROE2DRAFT_6062 [Piromyces sp. E2]|nr:hypothetical protein PIROE2DRAFT_6062 [Piromyces sp. E2]|eukprot:OUM66645.1 hypothetical protein PIROE2DRAFT_6062 [Piromyces sp. E2]